MATLRSIIIRLGTILCILAVFMVQSAHAEVGNAGTATISVTISESFLQYLNKQREETSAASLYLPLIASVPDSTTVLHSKN